MSYRTYIRVSVAIIAIIFLLSGLFVGVQTAEHRFDCQSGAVFTAIEIDSEPDQFVYYRHLNDPEKRWVKRTMESNESYFIKSSNINQTTEKSLRNFAVNVKYDSEYYYVASELSECDIPLEMLFIGVFSFMVGISLLYGVKNKKFSNAIKSYRT